MPRDQEPKTAEQKIEEARRSDSKELDLTPQGTEPKLTDLPESLCKVSNLESLSLAGNAFTTLPDWLGKLTKLKSLDLSANKFGALPQAICRLHNLQDLNLERNRLSTLPECLGDLR